MAVKTSGPICAMAPFWNRKASPHSMVQTISSRTASERGMMGAGSLEFGVERGDQALDFFGRRIVHERHPQDSVRRIDAERLEHPVAVEMTAADADIVPRNHACHMRRRTIDDDR